MAKVSFTSGRIVGASCPADKSQAFVWDTRTPGLALRVTRKGARSFVFQSRLKDGPALRMTIGAPEVWTIPAAQTEARRLQALIDQGRDPRIERAEAAEHDARKRAAAQAERAARDVLALDAWSAYIEERREKWSARHYADHAGMTAKGGEERKRAKEKLTKPGPLRPLLNRPLAELDAEAVGEWVARETKKRPARAALGFRLLRAFVRWCSESPEYRGIVRADACAERRTREKLHKPAKKDDVLQREMLRAWFAEVHKLNPVPAAYLQCLLLTGARREEMLGLRWQDVDFRWQALRIGDKVEGERSIPLTPFVARLLRDLKARAETAPEAPRRLRKVDPEAAERMRREWKPSPWVFASARAVSRRFAEPRYAHGLALAAAGLPHVSLHGLRRSFGTLSEWCEVPAGIVAQIMGHKPSAIAEKHYRVRPLDLLRMWHEKIEAFMLAEAGIEAPTQSAAPVLALVTT